MAAPADNNIPHDIPDDVVFEILTRTSLRTLDTCKCVAKTWKEDIIEDSIFLPTYCERTKNLSGFFLQDIRPLDYLSMFTSIDHSSPSDRISCLPRDMKILASCNQGILCCIKRTCRQYRYYVCKPATEQWRSLPNPKLRHWTVGVAIRVFESNPLRFKVIRISKKGFAKFSELYEYYCEIFDSNTWRWRETETLFLPDEEFILDRVASIFVKCSYHWLTYDNNVVAFHDPTESFSTFHLPELMSKGYRKYTHKQLVDYQGRLGLSCMTDESTIELWLLETSNGIENEWKKHVVVDIGPVREKVMWPNPAGFYNSGFILLQGVYEVFIYKIKDGSLVRVKLKNGLSRGDEIYSFRSDLEMVNF
ncbi:putative F-box protein At1g19160 [Andrographis paniculata]|uniref:putative F-box protein At1g19160 n=1 Tax=Andrographis paniculata TaxID=175694 RepID=UPI0021E8744E|nr:putative F-box protein At1g19160 [Andrographis paniculata]